MITKHKEIISIFENDTCIGFMCRRSVVFGFMLGVPDGWVITKSMLNLIWEGNFATRKEAIEYLRGRK